MKPFKRPRRAPGVPRQSRVPNLNGLDKGQVIAALKRLVGTVPDCFCKTCGKECSSLFMLENLSPWSLLIEWYCEEHYPSPHSTADAEKN